MIARHPQFGGFVVWIFVAASLLAGPGVARGAAATYELCLEQSPTRAGRLMPDSGTHHFDVDSVVTVTADPQPGYEFAYWLGDVSDPKAPRTTVNLNAPKVVVAVYQPVGDKEIKQNVTAGGGGGFGGPLIKAPIDLRTPQWSISAGSSSKTKTVPVAVPVVVTPEPSTIALFGLGALILRRRRRR